VARAHVSLIADVLRGAQGRCSLADQRCRSAEERVQMLQTELEFVRSEREKALVCPSFQ
jgi:hypothetical protein